jgi:acetyltransferase
MSEVKPFDLTPFFRPASVAVVGAGERPTSSGGAVMQNLAIAGYSGRVVPINPKGGTVFGRAALPSLSALDVPAELVVVVVRPESIPDVVAEAGRSGHRHLLILPGGFAEAGAEGRARDARVRGIAAEYGVTVAGPNCAGIIRLVDGARFAATFLRDMPPGGGIALVSQSGALAEEAIAASHRQNIPLGTVVSVGNGMHLGIDDYLDHLGDDPTCAAVLLYLESVDEPARFRRIARRVAARKPVVALVGGRTGPGGRAASAHTGAVVNGRESIEVFMADAGVIEVDSLRRLLLAAKGFARYPQGLGRRVLMLSNSGGPGVLATDRAAAEGLDLVDLPARFAGILKQALPSEASVANPLDLLADAREDRFAHTLAAALNETDAFDAILMIHVVPFMVDAAPVVERLAELGRGAGIALMHSMMGTLPNRAEWFARMETAGVPMFDDAEAMAETAGLLARYPEARATALANADAPITLRGRSAT